MAGTVNRQILLKSRPAGMPVQAWTTSAMSSGPTSSLSIESLPTAIGKVHWILASSQRSFINRLMR